MPTARRIGYIVNAFPVVSETFILNELRAMERAGVATAILALTHRTDPVRHGGIEELSAPVCRPPAMLRSHIRAATRFPRAWLRRAGELGGDRRRIARRRRRLLLAAWIAGEARRLGIVHLHAHYAKEPLAVAEQVRRLTGLPYSFAAHAKDLYTASPWTLARRLRHATLAVVCHAHGLEYLRSIAAAEDAAKIKLVHHGIDTTLFRRTGQVDNGGPPEILAVGRLTPKKGFEDLIAACRILAERGSTFRCTIVGEGRLEPGLREAIRQAGLDDRVTIEPFLSQELLVGRYRGATVLAAPSRVTRDGNRDGIPNVVLEAMACGLPVVSTPVGGIPEMVGDGVEGRLVEPGNPRALAAALAGILGDRTVAAAMSRSASNRVAAHDFRETVQPLVDRFRAIVAAPVTAALKRAEREAWRDGGLADRAGKVLGVRPRREVEVERSMARFVTPGLTANAWRPDLDRLAQRRMWDEVFKGRRLRRAGPQRDWSGMRVLDLGCGRGGLAVSLAARGAEVVALDLRRRNCAVTRLRGQRYGIRPAVITARAETLPLANCAFDHVFCLEVLEHVHDPAAVLREIRRVLVPGGTCTVTMINRWSHLDPHYHLWWVNLMPRSWARRYITLRGRTKRSWRDLQTLDEMHYFHYRRFIELVRRIGFDVAGPVTTDGPRLNARLRAASRYLSLGFNTATLTLVSDAARAS